MYSLILPKRINLTEWLHIVYNIQRISLIVENSLWFQENMKN